MFKSALYPAVIQFKVYQGQAGAGGGDTDGLDGSSGSFSQRRLSRGSSKVSLVSSHSPVSVPSMFLSIAGPLESSMAEQA